MSAPVVIERTFAQTSGPAMPAQFFMMTAPDWSAIVPGEVEAYWWRVVGASIEQSGGFILHRLALYRDLPVSVSAAMLVRFREHLNEFAKRKRLTVGERAIFAYLLAEEAEDEQ